MVEPVTGLILAGGKSTRMGGKDKALLHMDGTPMIATVITRLLPQFDEMLINNNRKLPAMRAFGYPVVADNVGEYPGPLAGVQAGLSKAATPLLACVPCDAPLLPADLVSRLQVALVDAAADIAVVRTASGLQPTFFVCRTHLAGSVARSLAAGVHALQEWMVSERCIQVPFEHERPFTNVNTPGDVDTYERGAA